MNRAEIIFELAKHAHPSWYHQLLYWETSALKTLLHYYEEGGEIKKAESIVVFKIESDFAYRIKDGEPLKNKQRFNDMRPKK